MRGNEARRIAERLSPYLVLKQHHVRAFIELVDAADILRTRGMIFDVREKVKAIRAEGAIHQPNFPSRKWMAGYVDGDGSFNVKVCAKTGYAYPSLSILAAKNYLVGITLLQRAFGGRIVAIGENASWQLSLSQPSKIQQVLEFCAQHLYRKKAQAYFLLGCATNGNLRDGEAINRAIKTLNVQQQRLNDPTAEATKLLQGIRFDIPCRPLGRPRGVIETKPRQKR
jgi:hypothetical protein